ncbi:hypothetical protein EDC01DRAFT_610636 [Geopyxis carbonaria]|nr:hypothetical protein EDC01DRAFT_610636 [Geopyxis carbonaria]
MSSDSPDVPKGRKAFIPLECNPELMTSLVHTLGVSKKLSFVDVYSLTELDLLEFVPRPAYALLLVFPISSSYETARREEDSTIKDYNGKGEEEDPVWFKQTIRNACGMIGVLHAISNGKAKEEIQTNTPLANLLKKALPLSPLERAGVLEDSTELEAAHKSVATQGDSAVPDAQDDVDLHYVCFVKSEKDNHLYELDGRRKGPLDRGQLKPEDDVLSEDSRAVVQKFIEREKDSGRMEFSLVALTPSLD